MSTSVFRRQHAAFTLIELLVVAAIIGILMTLLLPTLARAKSSAGRANCTSNLRMVAIAATSWAHDNNGKYPWMLNADAGGAQDSNQAADQFLVLSNELSTPKMLACPSDRLVSVKSSWGSYASNSVVSVSYFAGLCASEKAPRAILLGDRNLTGLSDMSECQNASALYAGGISTNSSWDPDVHHRAGNVTFVDGSVLHLKTPQLRMAAETARAGTSCGQNHVLTPCPKCVVLAP